MADISSTLRAWSATAASNAPSGSTAIGGGLDDNLREIQAVVRAYLAGAPNNIASATPDLSNATTNYVNITGTTTITSFGTVSSGIHHIIKFADALTLTHNATSLILPGGANITTAAGDMMLIVSEGSGNWRCINYTYATGQIINGGPVLIGHTALIATFNNSTASGATPNAQQHGLTIDNASAAIALWNATDNAQPQYTFAKSAGATIGTYTAAATGEYLGQLRWEGSDGTDFSPAGRIYMIVDGAVAAGQMPGRLIFDTSDSAGAFQSRMEITSTGAVMIGDTANANNTAGLTINMQTADDDIVTLKSSDVVHAMTALTEADTFGTFSKSTSTAGGLHISGYRDADGVAGNALFFQGTLGEAADATKSTAGIGIVSFSCEVTDGGTGATTAAANANLFVVRNDATTRFILDADGDSHQDVGTAWTNFDHLDDIATLDALSYNVARADDPIKRKFGEWMTEKREVLAAQKLVEFNDDGHHFVNMSRLTMLNTGAIRQMGERMEHLMAENARLSATLQRLEHRA